MVKMKAIIEMMQSAVNIIDVLLALSHLSLG
jgi:hypothetical protein